MFMQNTLHLLSLSWSGRLGGDMVNHDQMNEIADILHKWTGMLTTNFFRAFIRCMEIRLQFLPPGYNMSFSSWSRDQLNGYGGDKKRLFAQFSVIKY